MMTRKLFTSLFFALSFFISAISLFNNLSLVFAEGPTVNHRFFMEMPNGAKKPLPGASIHYVTNIRFDSDSGWRVFNSCRYPVEGEDVQRRGGLSLSCDPSNPRCHMCETWNSCFTEDYGGPYLPPSYNSSEKIYQKTNYDSSYKFFTDETFVDMLQREFPVLVGKYTNTNFRGFPNAKWIGSVDFTEGGSVSIVSSDEEFNNFKSRLEQVGMTEQWKPSTTMGEFTDPSSWEKGEIFLKRKGGNILHGGVTWTLQVSVPENKNPQCAGFNSYKGDWSSTERLNATSQLALTDTISVKQANKDDDGRPDRQDLCWSASGLTNEEYATGRAVFACATTCSIANGNYDQPVAGTQVKTLDASGNEVDRPASELGIQIVCETEAANTLRGGTTATFEKYIASLPSAVQGKARQNGLIFVQNAWNHKDPGNLFCTTNPYKGTESGVIWNGGNGNEILNTNCGQTPEGENCTRRVTVAVAPPPSLSCVGTSVNPTSLDQTTTSVTTTCQPVQGAVKFLIKHPFGGETLVDATTPRASTQVPSTVNGQPTLTPGATYTAGCVPCSGTTISTCQGAVNGDVTMESIPAACKATVAVGQPTMACAGTTISPSSIIAGSSTPINLTCTRVNGATKYKLTIPDNDNPGSSKTLFVNAPATGNLVYPFTLNRLLTAGTQSATCLPCVGSSDVPTCAPIIPVCNASFTVNSGVATCTSKVGTYKGQPLSQATSVQRGDYIDYAVTVNINGVTNQNVIVDDVFDTNALSWDGTGADAGVTYDQNTKKITINFGKASGNITKRYKLKANDVRAGTQFSNTATLIHNGSATTSQQCGSSGGTIPDIGEIMCPDNGKKAYLVKSANGQETFTELTSTSSVARGSIIEYRVTIKNNDYVAAKDGVVEDTLNIANVAFTANSFRPANQFMAFDQTAGKLKFKVPVQVGADGKINPSSTVSYRVTVLDKPQPTVIPNIIKIIDNGLGKTVETQCKATFNRESAGSAVCERKQAFDDKGNPLTSNTSAPTYVDKGQTFKYEIIVTASQLTTGPVTVVDILPAKLEFIDAKIENNPATVSPESQADGTTKLTFTIPAFGSAGSPSAPEKRLITINAKVKADASPGNIANSASVSTQGSQTVSSCAHTLAVPPDGVAKCEVKEMFTVNGSQNGTKINSGTVVNSGSELFYQIKVTATAQTAGKVEVTDTLPGGMILVDKLDFDSYDQNSGLLKKTFQAFSGEKIIRAKVKVRDNNAAGPITNTAFVQSFDRNNQPLGGRTSCATELVVPAYACDSSCTTNTQCEGVNADYICASDQGNRCRLKSAPTASNCQAPGYYCDSPCETNAQCEGVNNNYSCADTPQGKRCRLKANPSDFSCQPVRATPTPTPTVGCNSACVNNADCSNPQHVCFESRCRLAENVSSESCTVAGAPARPATPPPPAELPVAGDENWVTWLKAGAVVLGLGALLLLVL